MARGSGLKRGTDHVVDWLLRKGSHPSENEGMKVGNGFQKIS